MRHIALGFLLVVMASYCLGAGADVEPGGRLQILDEKGASRDCPLQHTEVAAELSGFVARVTVTQQYRNPLDEAIEAVYVFPLSERGAVDAMTMQIGDRTVKGLIKKREEARHLYEQARSEGKTASLLDQERPNIFTQSVANIPPGATVDITISYVETLKYEEGAYEFSFPMVVGPRYIPGGAPVVDEGQRGMVQPSPQVPDADRITPPVTPEGTRAGHDINLTVRVDAGMPLLDIKSTLHEVAVEQPDASHAVVRLKNQQEIPNRDFVLRYKTAKDEIGDAILSHTDARGGFFTLVLQPPARVTPDTVVPKEIVFVIDSSGSMSGFPIEKAKEVMRGCIEGMNPNDTFNLVSFSGGLGYCFEHAVPNTEANRKQALGYLENLQGGGGTEMMAAIHAALSQRDPKRLRVVCFMTDGFIGNDMEILGAIRKNVENARVFAFGIGNGVNRFLIEGMAREGRGEAEIVTLETGADEPAKRFQQRVQHPVLTDITVDFEDLPVEEVYPDPQEVPDLFSVQPLVLKGRYTGHGKGTVVIRGNTAAGPFERKIAVELPGDNPEHEALAPMWARARVDRLMAEDWQGIQQGSPKPKIREEITKLGLDFSLMTQYTSFVAVEEKVVTKGGKPKRVEVPVEMTDGVSYEGVFGDSNVVASLGYMPSRGKAARMAAPMGAACAMPAPACTAPAPPVAEPTAGEPAKADISQSDAELRQETAKEEAEAKPGLDPALKGKFDETLWRYVESGGTSGGVLAEGDTVRVFLHLDTDDEASLKALRELGVTITNHSRAGKKLIVRVRLSDLAAVAKLAFVRKLGVS